MNNIQNNSIELPEGFLYGVATAAYQIEGAANKDGRGRSIWDDFSHTSGKVVNNDNGDVACDHYNRLQSDLDLIKTLNVGAYRFSFSWPRILPEGIGAINDTGLDFYDRLIDGCLERDLKPFATLYHWDLPSALQQNGGWTHRETAHAFAQYAGIIAEKFGDRLDSLTTFNEPWCSSILGYLVGIHAPGLKDLDQTLKAIHYQHLGHGLAVEKIRSIKPNLSVGIVLNLQSIYAGSDSAADQDAAVRHEVFNNGVFLDPLFNGQYPSAFVEALGDKLPKDWQNDLAQIHQPLDYWGLNYYTPARVSAQAPQDPQCDSTDIGWEINASTLEDLLVKTYKHYTLPPCYITENGACFNDEPESGVVNDDRRVSYLYNHITAVANTCKSGVPVKGYFAWSLMDNFEWAEGYSMRFGLVHVDYQTQVRTIKQSGHWFAQLASCTNQGR
ncbi:UNVERIFIED_CONTAM: hypothetical protein GTU68_063765 [Idotea baltica]|nr:hypothetical protein [Idotea baltica]